MTKEKLPQPDAMPEVDDDVEVAAPPVIGEEQHGPNEPPAPVATSQAEEARERAVQRYRELRDQEPKAQQNGEPTEANNSDPEAPQAQPAQKVRLKIDGREVERDLSELIKNAQVYEAADRRLEEAKRLVNEAKSLRSQQPAPEDMRPDLPEHRNEDPHRQKLRDIAERLQVGDAEEGAQALAEILDPAEIDRRIDLRMRMSRVEQENQRALEKFSRDFSDVVGSRLITRAAETVLAEEISADLRALGVSEENIRTANGNVEALSRVRNHFAAQGAAVRSPDKILAKVGATLRREFNLSGAGKPEPDRRAQERIERKRSSAQQPRAVGLRTPLAPPTRPPTAADIVAGIRRARGFPTTR